MSEVLTFVASVAAAVLAAWLRAREEVRNALPQHRSEVEDLLGRARLSIESAHAAMSDEADRVARERARVEQAERRAARRVAENAPQARASFVDAASYKRHLARGGKRDLAFEASQGWRGPATEQ
jgi:hypothetical protein